jgi:pyruvate kinase
MEWARTKIVATIGPATAEPRILRRIIAAGLDVARLNFSHGTAAEHRQFAKHIRAAAKAEGKMVALLQDLQGPKIRVAHVPAEGRPLKVGEKITVVSHGPKEGDLVIPYGRLSRDVSVGHTILLDDGLLVLEVRSVRAGRVHAVVRVGGTLMPNKGVNFPDSTLHLPELTEKDREDVLVGLALGVEWVCVSFVSGPEPVQELRALVAREARRLGITPPRIMAKVERRAAIERLPEILAAADGVLLGRGDLGVEVPPEEVPILQKQVIDSCRSVGIPVIVATHMLESMRQSPRATRAEYSDIATAVFEGADAVMLSAETATGRYPSAAVQAMAAVIHEAESSHLLEQAAVFNDYTEATALAQTLQHLDEGGRLGAVVVDGAARSLLAAIAHCRLRVPVFVTASVAREAVAEVVRYGVFPLVVDHGVATWKQRVPTLVKETRLVPRGSLVALLEQAPHRTALEIIPRI